MFVEFYVKLFLCNFTQNDVGLYYVYRFYCVRMYYIMLCDAFNITVLYSRDNCIHFSWVKTNPYFQSVTSILQSILNFLLTNPSKIHLMGRYPPISVFSYYTFRCLSTCNVYTSP